VGWGSSVGIATRYGLDGTEIETRWGGGRFSAPVQTGPGAHPAAYRMGTGSFPGEKWPGRCVDHPPSSARVKERVGLYLYSPSGPSWPVLGRTVPLPLPPQVIHRTDGVGRGGGCIHPGRLSFVRWRLKFGVLSMERAWYRPLGTVPSLAYNYDVVPIFLENLCTPAATSQF
jgi:hypothetical protein